MQQASLSETERKLAAERRVTAMLQQSLLLVAESLGMPPANVQVFKERIEANMQAARAGQPMAPLGRRADA